MSEPKPVYCNVCGNVFKTSDTLETHAKCRKPSEPAEAAGELDEIDAILSNFYGWVIANNKIGEHHATATETKAAIQALIHSALSRRDEEWRREAETLMLLTRVTSRELENLTARMSPKSDLNKGESI